MPAAWATEIRFLEQKGMSSLIMGLELSAMEQVQIVLCRAKRPVREVDRTPASNIEDKNTWKWTSTPPTTYINGIVVNETSTQFYLSCKGLIFDKAFLDGQ